MSEPIASSGTMIAAALETVGLHYQAHILDSIMGPAGQAPIYWIASMLYIISAIVGLATFVLTQRYKFALWFFISPGLFFFCTTYRVETQGVAWIFGYDQRNEVMKDEAVRATMGAELKDEVLPPPRISWFYDGWNEKLSGVTRGLSGALVNGRKDADLRFMIRAPLYGSLVTSVIDDKNFKEFLHAALLGNCLKVYEASMTVYDNHAPETAREAAAEFLKKRSYVAYSEGAADWLASLIVDYPALWDAVEDLEWRKNSDRDTPFVGYDIEELIKIIEEADEQHRRDTSSSTFRKKRAENILAERESLLNCKEGWECSCDEIWNFTYIGLHRYAYQLLKSSTNQTDAVGIDREELYNDWMRAAGYGEIQGLSEEDKRVMLYRAIAKHIFRNEVADRQPAAIIADMAKRGQEIGSFAIKGENEIATVERMRVHNTQWSEKSRLVNTAAAIPYYQGLLLYVLGLSYPFWCFMLLIPGRHTGFLLFFGLHFWVKTWDVGYAVVIVLDEIFYTLFTGGMAAQHQANGTSPQMSDDIGLAFAAMKAVDPTFDLATYHNVIAVAISSVPIVTSYLTVGGLKGGSGLIHEGISGVSKTFANVGEMTSSGWGVLGYRRSTLARKASDVWSYQQNDTGDRPGFAGKGGKGGGHNVQPLNRHGGDRGIQSGGRGTGQYVPFGGGNHSLFSLGKVAVTAAGIAGGADAVRDDIKLIGRQGVGGADYSSPDKKNKWRDVNLTRGQKRALRRGGRRANAIRSVAKATSTIAGSISDISTKAFGAHMDRLSAWGSFDSMTSMDSIQDMKFARVYGVFELPFMDWEPDGNRIEFNIMLGDQQRFAKMVGDTMDALVNMGTDIWDYRSKQRFHDGLDHERGEKREFYNRVVGPRDNPNNNKFAGKVRSDTNKAYEQDSKDWRNSREHKNGVAQGEARVEQQLARERLKLEKQGELAKDKNWYPNQKQVRKSQAYEKTPQGQENLEKWKKELDDPFGNTLPHNQKGGGWRARGGERPNPKDGFTMSDLPLGFHAGALAMGGLDGSFRVPGLASQRLSNAVAEAQLKGLGDHPAVRHAQHIFNSPDATEAAYNDALLAVARTRQRHAHKGNTEKKNKHGPYGDDGGGSFA